MCVSISFYFCIYLFIYLLINKLPNIFFFLAPNLNFFEDRSNENENEKNELQLTDHEDFKKEKKYDQKEIKNYKEDYKDRKILKIKNSDNHENGDSDDSIINSVKKRNIDNLPKKIFHEKNSRHENLNNLPTQFLPKNENDAQKIIFFEIKRLREAFIDLKEENEIIENKVRILICF